MKQKITTIQIIRNVIQLICFLLIPGLFIDSFNGIKALIQAASGGTADFATILPSLFPSALLIIATLIFGRFFCGFMCAFGTLGDAVHFLGSKVFKINYRMPEAADKKLKWLKYIFLGFLIFTWITGIGVFDGWSPWDSFGSLLSLPPDFSYAFTSLTIGTILLLLIIIGSLFVERFFCRYLCPMGAVFSIVSKLKISKIKKTRTNCGNCKACTNKCKMGIALYQSDVVNSGECIQCMKCMSPCPRHNVKFTVASKDAAPLIASVAVVSVMGLYHVGNIAVAAYDPSSSQTAIVDVLSESDTSSAQNNASYDTSLTTSSENENDDTTSQTTQTPQDTATPSTETSVQTASGYLDGTYEGSGVGFHNGTTTVSVTISKGQITNIETVSTRDDGKYYNRAFSSITSQIVSSQSADVDAVSGATYSSDGIMSAVADALSQAKG